MPYKQMKIGNVRLGLATNSSSTHYIVILDKKKENTYIDDDIKNDSFGWNEFTCVTNKAKKGYLAQLLYYTLKKQGMDDNYASIIIDAWVGKNSFNNKGYIDHQSMFGFPFDYTGSCINKEFILDFKKFLLKKNVIIIGGNDNGGQNHSAHHDNDVKTMFRAHQLSTSNLISRKDGNVWFLLNTNNGARFSLSFDENENKFLPTKPLLVDLKITNNCLYNCKYCYQNSTPQGTHASSRFVQIILEALKKLEVFEVAIGGGEPTEHPSFNEFVLGVYGENPLPIRNFSTRNYEELKNVFATHETLTKDYNPFSKVGKKRLQNPELSAAGAAAFTINPGLSVYTTIKNLLKIRENNKNKIYIHYVMGTGTRSEFKEILQTAKVFNIPIILLGYKHFGRGANFKPKDYSDWIEVVKEVEMQVGIDTKLAQEFEKELKENTHNILYSSEETDTSMYIDAVSGVMKPHSYDPDPGIPLKSNKPNSDYIWNEIDDIANQIQKAFLQFRNRKAFKGKPFNRNLIDISGIIRK